ncbi:DUF3598 family protein [Pseudanabaena sp. FACHB-2040]|uniref:DUF3598 family protein n=1 Tax=Pseudanabaena sp. FACHB-2040 TaxID=2692859 RepID=UPI001684A53A|nr:DUF3598 family protein [Pseudanabaena sp. FACHB-2040]MBD2258518.1 DUF3598 family protein [Pseudanabaena sp. FACHB-2040]
MASQWERLLKNTGTWIGSFTQLSPTGEQLSDTPTEIALIPQDQGQMMRQEIRKRPPGGPPQETVLEYRSLGKGVLFCEDGAFSQGSIQWSPFGDFGAELGLIQGQERLRLVEIFKGERTLSSLTLIREYLQGTQPQSRPPVTVDQLLGTWEGEAVSVYPDWQPEDRTSTRLEIQPAGSDQIQQTLQFGQAPPIQSLGRIRENALQFDQGSQPVTVLMLPDGASATYPTQIEAGKPLFLEAGWLIQPDLRQRLIRAYSSQGTWVSLTLVTERKVA